VSTIETRSAVGRRSSRRPLRAAGAARTTPRPRPDRQNHPNHVIRANTPDAEADPVPANDRTTGGASRDATRSASAATSARP
jgi:hypothetical protein